MSSVRNVHVCKDADTINILEFHRLDMKVKLGWVKTVARVQASSLAESVRALTATEWVYLYESLTYHAYKQLLGCRLPRQSLGVPKRCKARL
jgi:hypothetical protein